MFHAILVDFLCQKMDILRQQNAKKKKKSLIFNQKRSNKKNTNLKNIDE